MSDGKTHATFNTIVLGATVVIATQLPLPLATGAVTGATIGYLLTPDIDLPGRTIEEARLGWLLGGLSQLFWRRYTQTHSHRGSSHRPWGGTVGRWKYIFVRLWWLIAIMFYYQHSFVMSHLFECFEFVCSMFYMNCAQDIVHLALDHWKYHKGD